MLPRCPALQRLIFNEDQPPKGGVTATPHCVIYFSAQQDFLQGKGFCQGSLSQDVEKEGGGVAGTAGSDLPDSLVPFMHES